MYKKHKKEKSMYDKLFRKGVLLTICYHNLQSFPNQNM